MRKSIYILFIAIIFLTISFGEVSAHFLATDKSIGAVIHVEPNDNPIAGQQARFFFEFKDTLNKFNSQDCDCTFLVVENGKTVSSQPLFANSDKPNLLNASILFTFPQKDVYQVKVVGKPLIDHAFQSFVLTWEFRIDQGVNGQGNLITTSNSGLLQFLSDHFIYDIIIVVSLIGILVFIIGNKQKGIISMKKEGEKNDKENKHDMY